MTDLERIIDVVGPLAPHRQYMVLQAAVALLELQFEADGVTRIGEPSVARAVATS